MSADEIYQSKYGQGRRLGDTEGHSSRMVELQADITKLKHSVAIAKRTLPSIESQAQRNIDSGLTQLNQDLIQANIALSEILNEPQAPDQIDVTRQSLRQLVSHLKAANKLANDSIEESQHIRESTIEHMNHYLKPVNSTFKSINKNIKAEQGILQANARRTKRQAETSLIVSRDLQVDIQTKQTEISTHQIALDEQREEVRILEARKKEAVRMMEEEEAEADRLQKRAEREIGVGFALAVISFGLLTPIAAALVVDANEKLNSAKEARSRALKLAVEFDRLNKSRMDLEDQSNKLNVELSQLRKEQSDMKTDMQRHKSRRTTLEAKLSEIAEKTVEAEQFSADVRALGAAFDKILTESKAIRQSLLELKLALQKLVEQVQEQEAPAVASQRRLNRAGTMVAPVAVMDHLRRIRPALDSLMASAGEISQSRLLAPS